MKFRYPVNYVAITQEFKKGKHFGIDLGWNSQFGGPNQPIYAAQDGEVVATKDNDYSGKSWGNYVKLYHGDNIYTLYGHMNHGLCVKKGQKVKMGDLLGYMGTTGVSTGNHLHYEIYDGGASTSYRIDPQPLTYVYEGQDVSKGSKDKVLYYAEEPKKELKSIDEVAQEVLEGKYGNNPERKEKLIAEGYDYSEVQGKVNELVKERNAKIKEDNETKEEKTILEYTIVKGDTLSKIAVKFDTTVEKLVELNDIKDPDKIYVGDKIRVK